MEIILGKRFLMKQRLSSGAFGEIYEGLDQTNNKKVALKLEKTRANKVQLLGEEAKIYKDLQGFVGFPEFYWFGTQIPYNILSIELLDNSLEGFLRKSGGKFSLKTVLMLADQMISTLECFHRHFYIHRDLKPENFMMGSDEKHNIVYLIDFGLSKRYIDPKNDFSHIPYKTHKNMTGTARYASINSLGGVEQSRRDDMESLGYIFVYFLKGKLPWQGLPGQTREEKYNNILEVKRTTPIDELCSGLPLQFANYLRIVKQLEFTDEPNYSAYREMFRDLLIQKNYIYDFQYDWVAPKATEPSAISAIPQMTPLPLMSQQPQWSQRSQSQTHSQHISQRSDFSLKNANHARKYSFDPRSFSANFPPIDSRNTKVPNKIPDKPTIPALKVPAIHNRRSSHVPTLCPGLNINFSGRSQQQPPQRQLPVINVNQSPTIVHPTKPPLQNKLPIGIGNPPLSPVKNKIPNTDASKFNTNTDQWKI